MKILIVNTSDCIGGAAIAANRLMKALQGEGADVSMLVMNKLTDSDNVCEIRGTLKKKLDFVLERVVIWTHNCFSRKNLFTVSIANTGSDITKLPVFQEADIIHLHWFNQGMLSLSDLSKILHSGKRVFWTMHDMWPVTGICHHADECLKYQSSCHDCRLLAIPSKHDLSCRIFKGKKKVYSGDYPVFVACSQWLANLAERSQLTNGHRVISIPNPIDTSLFCPSEKHSARIQMGLPLDKKLILFAAQKVTNPMKGMSYLAEACNIIFQRYPELSNLGLVIIGTKTDELSAVLPFDVYKMDYIDGKQAMCRLYNAVDLFVTPSLLENLPNTIMESLSCGLPCVGFHVGGIPEMIDHRKNGYVAEYKSAEDLAEGIRWCLQDADYESLSQNARDKAVTHYSMSNIAQQFLSLYATV